MLRALPEVGEQEAGALCIQPVEDGLLGAEDERVLGEAEGEARRTTPIPALAVEPIRALPCLGDSFGVVEPPVRSAQALQRLGRLNERACLLEEHGCTVPVGLAQRVVRAGDELLLRCDRIGHVSPVWPNRGRDGIPRAFSEGEG